MKEKRVKDIMLLLQEYATVPKGATIEQALVALNEAQLGLTENRYYHRAILVLDHAGNVCGKLSHWAILRTLEPKLLGPQDLASLNRVNLSEQFVADLMARTPAPKASLEHICRAAATVKVEDAMVPTNEYIDENETLSAVIDILVRSRAQSVLVRRQGVDSAKVVGIVRLSDAFEEIAKLIRSEDCGCDDRAEIAD